MARVSKAGLRYAPVRPQFVELKSAHSFLERFHVRWASYTELGQASTWSNMRSLTTITKICIPALSAVCMLLFCALPLLAQGHTTGRINGTVKDPAGALIPGAQITVNSRITGEERTAITDDQGNFTVPLLAPGEYTVKIAAKGFNTSFFPSVMVVITETTSVNAYLIVAGVIDDALNVPISPLLEREGPQLGRSVNTRAVSELPLATRNFTQILALSPGA